MKANNTITQRNVGVRGMLQQNSSLKAETDMRLNPRVEFSLTTAGN